MRSVRSGLAMFSVFLITAVAFGGPLGVDPGGIPSFTGTVSFNASDTLLVDLDFAVFAPGDYPDDGIHGDDPSDGAEYVYAYQAFNVSATTTLTSVSVGLQDDSGAGNETFDPLHDLTGGVAPSMISLYANSAIFRFLDPLLFPNEHSTVFLFTSANAPTFDSVSVVGEGFSDVEMAPSPIPEPTSALLLGLGGWLALARRRT